MPRLHLICRQELNLTKVAHMVYASGNWDMSPDEARRLIGGTIHLHESKAEPSYFGGLVTDVEEVRSPDVAHQDRIRFIFTPTREAKNVRWRGLDHDRAWSSGILSDV